MSKSNTVITWVYTYTWFNKVPFSNLYDCSIAYNSDDVPYFAMDRIEFIRDALANLWHNPRSFFNPIIPCQYPY